jgi:DNA-binding MarR family transcriptional regulator
MSELSRFLMVTGGNVTGVTDELVREGMVTRTNSASDRRSWIVSLTAEGHAAFQAMAQEHEQWILEFFSGMDASTVQTLYNHLGRLRVQLVRQQEPQTKDRP